MHRFAWILFALCSLPACEIVDSNHGCPGHQTFVVPLSPADGGVDAASGAGADSGAGTVVDCAAACKARTFGDELESCRFVSGDAGAPSVECSWLFYCE